MTTNIYPAKVRLGQRVWPKARVRTDATEQRIQVWVSARAYPHRPVCIIDEPIMSVVEPYNKWARMRDRTAQWDLEDGRLEVLALPGCGCSSSLKTLPSMTAENQAQDDTIDPATVGVS